MSMYTEEVIFDICQRVLRDEALDIFYIITQNPEGISKIDVQRDYNRQLGLPEESSRSRHLVGEAIALLRGATFVDFFPEGTSQKYFVTKNGEVAAYLINQLISNKPELLKTSKIVSKIMRVEG